MWGPQTKPTLDNRNSALSSVVWAMNQGTPGRHISLICTNELQCLNKSSQFGLSFLSLAKRIVTKAKGENAKWQFDSYHLGSPVKRKEKFLSINVAFSCVHAQLLSHGRLCDPMDCSPPGSPVHGILQARILKWVVISYSTGSSQPRDWTHVSCISWDSCIGR